VKTLRKTENQAKLDESLLKKTLFSDVSKLYVFYLMSIRTKYLQKVLEKCELLYHLWHSSNANNIHENIINKNKVNRKLIKLTIFFCENVRYTKLIPLLFQLHSSIFFHRKEILK